MSEQGRCQSLRKGGHSIEPGSSMNRVICKQYSWSKCMALLSRKINIDHIIESGLKAYRIFFLASLLCLHTKNDYAPILNSAYTLKMILTSFWLLCNTILQKSKVLARSEQKQVVIVRTCVFPYPCQCSFTSVSRCLNACINLISSPQLTQ